MKGIDAIIEAGYSVYNDNGGIDRVLASKIARDNLLKGSIQQYNDILFARAGYHEESAGKQLLKLMNQDADLGSKARGLDIYYKKKGSYAPEKHDYGLSAEVQRIMEHMRKILPKAK